MTLIELGDILNSFIPHGKPNWEKSQSGFNQFKKTFLSSGVISSPFILPSIIFNVITEPEILAESFAVKGEKLSVDNKANGFPGTLLRLTEPFTITAPFSKVKLALLKILFAVELLPISWLIIS